MTVAARGDARSPASTGPRLTPALALALALTLMSAAAAALAGCDAGVEGRTGLQALLRVNGATFVAGALPTATDPAAGDGPLVTIGQLHSLVTPGADRRVLSGSAQAGTRSIAIGLADDRAYWILPAATADREIGAGTDLLFSTTVSYSLDLPLGRHDLVLRALRADGRMGPAAVQALSAAGTDVTGALVVSLSWDSDADLDLHVVAPNPAGSDPPGTTEVWVKNPSSLPSRTFAAGGPYSPEELAMGGQLDLDSNGGCLIDGRRAEHVVWGAAPPPGSYLVRVDAVSMCGQSAARWRVEVVADGASLAAAYGQMSDADTRFSHTQGSGVLAVGFVIP